MFPRIKLESVDPKKSFIDGALIIKTLERGDVPEILARDISSLATIYAVAHESAILHPSLVTTIRISMDNRENLKLLRETFSQHPHLLPGNIKIRFSLDAYKTSIRGKGVADPAFHTNACYLIQLAELEQRNVSDKIDVAACVDFYEFQTYRKLSSGVSCMALLLDADNCIYNFKFRILLAMLIFHHAKQIKAAATLLHDAASKDDLSEILMKELTQANFPTLTDEIVEKWLQHINMNIDYDDADLKRDLSPNIEDRYKTVFRQYIRYLNKINPAIMTFLLYRANEYLFERVIWRAEKEGCAGIIVKSFSARQSHFEDVLNDRSLGTGSYLHDLHELVRFLNDRFRKRISFVHDRFLMADAYNNLTPGESYKRGLTQSGNHPYSVLDPSKTAMLIVFSHYLKSRYQGVKLAHILDDRHDLYAGFLQLFGGARELCALPESLRLTMVTYDGDFDKLHLPCTLVGGGEVKHDIHRLTQSIVAYSNCDLKLIGSGCITHHIGKTLQLGSLLGFESQSSRVSKLFKPYIIFHTPDAYGRHENKENASDKLEKATHRLH